MTTSKNSMDVIVLVADKQMEAAVDSLLRHRQRSLGIREIQFEIVTHPRKDPGCLIDAHLFLKPFLNRFNRSLILFDHDGCGQESRPIDELAQGVEKQMMTSGWKENRTRCIILDPELEIWVWSNTSEVDRLCGWEGRQPRLREWLFLNGWIEAESAKPEKPKEALLSALREVRKQPSSALMRELAKSVGLKHCHDPAFLTLKSTLVDWFPL